MLCKSKKHPERRAAATEKPFEKPANEEKRAVNVEEIRLPWKL